MKLESAGIKEIRVRRAITGGVIIEIPGEKSAKKADQLAGRLREFFPDGRGLKMTRPIKMAERSGRLGHSGRGSVSGGFGGRLQRLRHKDGGGLTPYPDEHGDRVATVLGRSGEETYHRGESTGRMGVGASRGAEHPPPPMFPMHRSGAYGIRHNAARRTRTAAVSAIGAGHWARECTAPVRCLICTDLGRPGDYRFDSKACRPPTRPKRRSATSNCGGQNKGLEAS
ncbi:unnamed protein product [Heterotrigona itama]|uniref:Uncharacterized protein n=1 Tax=Heterotrigona itama TaxID=395501 RepID=A0A6V7GVI4_9HYME|nr:unnamed protein product [Heterotrigona itama]